MCIRDSPIGDPRVLSDQELYDVTAKKIGAQKVLHQKAKNQWDQLQEASPDLADMLRQDIRTELGFTPEENVEEHMPMWFKAKKHGYAEGGSISQQAKKSVSFAKGGKVTLNSLKKKYI